MIANIVEAFKVKANLGILVLILLVGFNTAQINTIMDSNGELLKKSTTEYAFTVVSYGLKDAQSDSDIVAQIIKWRDMEWGAQIGAINTICRVDYSRLLDLMDQSTAVKACRLSGF